MMTTPDPLVLQFASGKPAEVAELLSTSETEETLELIRELPEDVAARVLARMSSRSMSRLLEKMQPERLGKILIAADHSDVLTLISHMHERAYDPVLNAVDSKNRATLRRLFDQPQQILAALASPNFIRVTSDTLCETVANDLMASPSNVEVPIFVVDNQGKFAGAINTQTVIARKNLNTPVSKLMKRFEPLPSDMKAAAAIHAAQWVSANALPVVNAEHQIIGAVTLEELNRVAGPDEIISGFDTIFSELALSYLDLLANIVSSAFKGTPKRKGEK
ncbi:MAG: magnesium transporter [Pseudomonadales bacterium]|nr:magnesium transporter [Pseudomonadales bacterium]